MTVLHETVDVARPVEEAFAYVSDFTTTAEWDSTALTARKLTSGKIAAGTEFEVVCALPVGSVTLIYEVTDLQPGKLIELSGRSKFFDIRDTISFSPSDRGTKIDYRAEFQFKPLIKPFASLAQAGLEKMGRESVASLGVALEDNYSITALPDAGGHSATSLVPELSRFTRLGYKLGRKRFNPTSTFVKGKHMVVTGASAGLGYATAFELARRGAELTLVVRDQAKAENMVAALESATGNTDIRYELADLSLMADVDRLVKRLNRRGKAVDVLVNNAGALFNQRSETTEGLEQNYALLLLSPCRLTEGLKPLLAKATAPRVVNVVSGGMYSQKLEVGGLLNDDAKAYSGSVAYAREKRALMVLTEEWAREWAEEGIVVNAMHPGWADTPGVRNALPAFRKFTRRVLRSAEEGADTIVWLSVAKEAGRVSGKLFLDRQIRATHLLKKTRESTEERRKLLDFLKTFPGTQSVPGKT